MFDYVTTRSARCSEAPTRATSAGAGSYDREDADYERLVRRWQRELDLAREEGDLIRIEGVQRTLRAARLQRQRQLAERALGDEPPF